MERGLILASGSPRRLALLASLGLSFDVEVADVDERPRLGEAPDELVLRLSRCKAQKVAVRHANAVILAADTVVVLDRAILGKPADPDGAARMLRALRARVHQVYTAVSVAVDGRLSTRLSESNVRMRPYGDAEIRAYVGTGDPLDKAGAYAIQHPVFSPVDTWEGCYAGIMGLPLEVTAELLEDAGIKLPVGIPAVCEQWSGRCCAQCK